MASELKRGAIRVGSNYTRLALNLALGMAFVPILFIGVGAEAFGLIGLLASSMGVAEMFRSIVSESLKRELGAAYHSANPEDFPNTYNAAIGLTLAMFLGTIALFAVVYAILPLLKIDDDLMNAAQWLVIAKGAYSAFIVLLGPAINMYQVSERMVLSNTWNILDRVTDFLAALVLFIFLRWRDPSAGLIAYGLLSAGTGIGVWLTAAVLIVLKDRRLIPRPGRMRMAEIRKILPTAGWNTLVVTAMNMHIRLDQLIMNIVFGLIGNAMFTIATRLGGYVRMAASGSTLGIDAVSVRVSSKADSIGLAELTAHSTRLHAAVAVPSALLILILAEPIISAWIGWVGRAVENPEIIPGAVTLAKILVIGMTVRGIAESWQRILYGAGFIRAYGPWVLLGGILNPYIALVLIAYLPMSINYQGPAWAYSIAMIIVNFVWLPKITARCLNVTRREILAPLVRPTIVSLVAATVLFMPKVIRGGEDSLIILGLTVAGFAAAHAALCWLFVLTPQERSRFGGAVARRIRPTVPAGAAD